MAPDDGTHGGGGGNGLPAGAVEDPEAEASDPADCAMFHSVKANPALAAPLFSPHRGAPAHGPAFNVGPVFPMGSSQDSLKEAAAQSKLIYEQSREAKKQRMLEGFTEEIWQLASDRLNEEARKGKDGYETVKKELRQHYGKVLGKAAVDKVKLKAIAAQIKPLMPPKKKFLGIFERRREHKK